MDRAQLADFLRTRREALSPEDVGMPRGPRRRATGLRREEVAALAQMSVDYYSRLEQSRGPQPSEQMLAALSRALRLSLDERDHLFRISGHGTPSRSVRWEHISPGLMRVLDRLEDTPAQVMNVLGETMVQTPSAVALLGDQTHFTGLYRNATYRFFMHEASRARYPREDQDHHARVFTSDLREAASRVPDEPRVSDVVDALQDASVEFARVWAAHEVGRHHDEKRLVHPELGVIEVHCQHLHDPAQMQNLLVFTATPGSEDAEKLAFLNVLGRQQVG
ncbi:helix-turn-helix transcriptional regulator [Demequina activiva]|uniref:DNA-binding protein n=1 Tax=Demequina activiva TaxID=1582364 RepID=A0A919Q368_9MICO|nr:helix-turn-helix transcriptional regulator [Demequina activiva]GIG54764.1 DNA-binding protein [Demequina activiva]